MRLPHIHCLLSLGLLPKVKQVESDFFVFALGEHVGLKLLETSGSSGYLLGD